MAKYTTSGELELPETTYIRDVDNRVFEGIVIQSLAKISGISLTEGNFSLFGRTEQVKGIYTNQDEKNQSIDVKVEVSIAYGVSIPEKAEEIQTKIAEDLTKLTGLHVHQVHVVFKKLMAQKPLKETAKQASVSLVKEQPQECIEVL